MWIVVNSFFPSETDSDRDIRTNDKVRALRPDELSRWDTFVSLADFATIFHDSKWITYVANMSGRHVCLVGFFMNDELVAGVPITYKRKFGLRLAAGHSLLPYNNILFSPRLDFYDRRFIDRKIRRFLESSFDTVSMTTSDNEEKERDLLWRTHDVLTHHIEITSEARMYQRLSSDVRRHIRLALLAGYSFQHDCTNRDMYECLRASYRRRHLSPPITESAMASFDAFVRSNNIGRYYSVINKRGEIVSATLIVQMREICYGILLGTDPRTMRDGVTQFLLWEICRTLSEESAADVFDLRGGNSFGIGRFWISMGAKRIPYSVQEYYAHQWLRVSMRINISLHALRRRIPVTTIVKKEKLS